MRNRSRQILSLVLGGFFLFLAFSNSAVALNQIRIGCPQIVNPIVPGDSIQIPVYITNDVQLGEFSMGFTWNSSHIRIISIEVDPACFTAAQLAGWFVFPFGPDTNYVAFGWLNISGTRPFHTQLSENVLCRMTAVVQPSATDASIAFDTLAVLSHGALEFTPTSGPRFIPEFVHCPDGDIILGSGGTPQGICGDADESGRINIADILTIVRYVFAGFKGNIHAIGADADCDGVITASDAVYLLNYIFASGPAPCAACQYPPTPSMRSAVYQFCRSKPLRF